MNCCCQASSAGRAFSAGADLAELLESADKPPAVNERDAARLGEVFLRIREEAGLPHLRIHDLRHQFASHLVSAGKSLYQVQQLLGHSDPKVTMRYSHLSTAALRDATDAASDALTRASKPTETATE